MLITPILLALFYAVIISLLFGLLFRKKLPFGNFGKLFVALFLILISANLWLRSFGPIAFGYYWLPGLLFSIIIALFLASINTMREKSDVDNDEISPNKTDSRIIEAFREADRQTFKGVGFIYWLLITLLIIIIISFTLLSTQ